MQTEIAQIAAAIIAIAAIGGFAFLYAKAMFEAWRQPTVKQAHGTAYVYVATILAGLVGGVAAMVFNEELPKVPIDGAANASPTAAAPQADSPETLSTFGPQAGGTALFRSVNVFSYSNFLPAMSAVYVLVYLMIGIAGIITWVRVGDTNTSDLVKNIALISIGLFVAILRTFFNIGNG
ncbi:hypothetical protein [Gimesia algae]|uniref:Uncharacterized protein n=1 Tax=Gimesia algae TaxID=2527971 RepID=A0A517V6G3_9PLAN|nr:hypothetical protein [Gimesia algae]QDT88596.1 hypothetical protein Pan161_02140 [Gimesia algae]